MKKAGLIDKIQVIGEQITKKEAEAQLKRVLDAIKEGLKEDGKVQLTGELTFEVVETKARSGEMNGVAWETPAGYKVKVKVADKFTKEVVGE